jgi:GTP-binding protein
VGKSSFINAFTGNGKLARTSSTPGRTRLINLFDVNSSLFTLVDLPGYGFAKASKAEKESWDALIGGYFENSRNLKRVIVLVDLRIPPTALDKQMLAYLYHYALPFSVVATKADKLSRAQADRARQTVAGELGLGKSNVIVFSSITKQGLSEVNALVDDALKS